MGFLAHPAQIPLVTSLMMMIMMICLPPPHSVMKIPLMMMVICCHLFVAFSQYNYLIGLKNPAKLKSPVRDTEFRKFIDKRNCSANRTN